MSDDSTQEPTTYRHRLYLFSSEFLPPPPPRLFHRRSTVCGTYSPAMVGLGEQLAFIARLSRKVGAARKENRPLAAFAQSFLILPLPERAVD
jgi:hypothetical protein